MQSVTIPMKRKDENGNVFEYRVEPLVFTDKRFMTIMDQIGKDLRTKFMKLYKRTEDMKERTPAIEMSSWLAVFAFQQLIAWHQILSELGQDPKMAALNTFNIFGNVFEHLLKEALGDVAEEIKAQIQSAGQKDPGAGDGVGGKAPDKAAPPEGSGPEGERSEVGREGVLPGGPGEDEAEAGEEGIPGGDRGEHPVGGDTDAENHGG